MRTKDFPQCSWVPVVDRSGRRRLEMRWALTGTGTALSTQDSLAATRAA